MAFRPLTNVFKLVKVAQKRRRGDVTTIAEQTGFSTSHVSNVLAGRRFNDGITNMAYRLTGRRMTLQEKLTALRSTTS